MHGSAAVLMKGLDILLRAVFLVGRKLSVPQLLQSTSFSERYILFSLVLYKFSYKIHVIKMNSWFADYVSSMVCL